MIDGADEPTVCYGGYNSGMGAEIQPTSRVGSTVASCAIILNNRADMLHPAAVVGLAIACIRIAALVLCALIYPARDDRDLFCAQCLLWRWRHPLVVSGFGDNLVKFAV